ncbi:NADH-cytochrome b5 reductase-like isoform X2 [Haliotis rufescens]|uniref:NADH-cytochrome b5 reductase-like isoform X2 n=1 Tax=Haliotis rufescens TaxID=6454 RepID=UPI00201F4876|nr:NADH-cytochrome b5 reductase-like isoform X2 [Haliotis rufescens]
MMAKCTDWPEKPIKPLDSDCCGNGCVPCVLDIYDEEVKIWEKECLRLQQKDNKHENVSDSEDEADEEPVLSKDRYRRVKIIFITMETKDSARYRMKLPREKSLGLCIGQHIIIRGYLDSTPVTRQYTPISDVEIKGYFDVLIKYQTLYLLAAGTGIAPMSQVIQGIVGDEDEETRVRLIYGCRTYADILMKAELDTWSSFWNFSVTYALSQETDESSSCYRYGDQVHAGRVTATLLDTELGDRKENLLVLICGTKTFEADMIDHLNTLGLSEDKYFRF